MRRTFQPFVFFFLLLTGLLASCEPECGCEAPPGFSESQLLHTWRLDEVGSAGQVGSRTEAIKGRYTITFETQGIYTQKTLAAGDEFQGTWELTNSGHTLELTDYKGDIQLYDLQGSWPNGGSQPEQISLHRENKDNIWETLTFTRIP